MMLFGLYLLCMALATEANYYGRRVITDHLGKVCIEGGKVKVLDNRNGNEALKSCWSPVITKNFSLDTAHYALVDLHGRNIMGFERGWFHLENYSLDTLDLSHNEIIDITSEMLNDLPTDLTSVELQRNKIKCLKNGVIDNKHLISLDLSSNSIHEIESAALNKLERLKLLYLQDNQLHNTQFAATLPTNLETLNLGVNAITEISPYSFLELGKLRSLSIYKNNITAIHHQAFNGLQGVVELDLSYNPIEKVEHGSFESTPLLKTIITDYWELESLADVDLRQSTYKNQMFRIVAL